MTERHFHVQIRSNLSRPLNTGMTSDVTRRISQKAGGFTRDFIINLEEGLADRVGELELA